MDNHTLLCGCTIQYQIENVGEYGWGGEIVDRWQISAATLIATCLDHTRHHPDDIAFGLAF